MESKQIRLVVLLVVLVAGALGMRHYFSPKQVVRRQLLEVVASFKNEKILGVMSKISRSYSDEWGGSYEILGGRVQSVMDAYDGLTVELDISSVTVAGDEARTELAFVLGGRTDAGRGNILGTVLDPCRATLRWVKEEPGWRFAETEELDIPEYREELERRRNR